MDPIVVFGSPNSGVQIEVNNDTTKVVSCFERVAITSPALKLRMNKPPIAAICRQSDGNSIAVFVYNLSL